MPLLSVEHLTVTFNPDSRPVPAVTGVDLHVDAGETLAVVGESGSGKTVTALSVLGLTPRPPACRTTGTIRLGDTDLTSLDARGWRSVRGRRVAMVFQDPSTALNPLLTLGTQIADAIRAHEPVGRAAARERALAALELARLPQPGTRLEQYPHQLSGGMRQRAAIALALAAGPQLLIADEPTTALDVAVQAEILDMLDTLRRDLGMGLILITHDLGTVATHADRVAVMYAGRVVETGPTGQVLGDPRMPYTRALLAATPRLDAPARQRLVAIGGHPPDLAVAAPGCAFAPRCPVALDVCRDERPALRPHAPDQLAACHHPEAPLPGPVAAEHDPTSAGEPTGEPVAEFDEVVLHYPVRRGLLRRVVDRVRAVDGVSLRLWPGRTLALVGESGSGKTSLTRTLLRLERPTGGTVSYSGIDVTRPDREQLRRLQREVQVVFQNPYASLDPRMTVAQILAEPLRVHRLDASRTELVRLLEQVGLDAAALDRHPAAFSGGQRQRIAIARALGPRPRLIVCDEAVSALDVSIQAQVLNLLADLQREHDLSYLFITHDLAVVRSVAHDIAVMRHGRIVEHGPAERIYGSPTHEYTRLLLEMAPGHPTQAPSGRTAAWSR
ncbi:ABC transporter ATP-binding protein [Micromonospora endolithica]|uniref:ABC transporter ATP-binding protein n=1 Tax=Micromonospora endolithica TaxID=230091 RepID=A0A3A9ZSK3_9ACTN|nr:ABC transporter ATP-binding protein [Micromonospora endolithica]RKN51190.1 ABC transporter ATP-binding protein [Micromonospora endolithica]TWJ22400.1 peptide/nickel transport system ATP-binding protein [Micromonospora endolithica]